MQYDANGKRICGVVTAFSGLKLREAPSFKAKTIAVIPFKEVVTYIHREGSENQEWLFDSDSIRGSFVEIKWRGKTGYAFNAYIADGILKTTEPGYLLFEGGWCWRDCYANPDYHYYGMFTNHDSTVWRLQKIKPVFVHIDDEFEGCGMRALGSKKPSFMLAMKDTLATGKVKVDHKKKYVYKSVQIPYPAVRGPVRIPGSQLSLIVSQVDDNGVTIVLQDKSSGRKQQLKKFEWVNSISLKWSGDLDQDGKPDFMLEFNNEHDGGCQLFISSLAKPGELVYPITAYIFGDCC